MAFLRRLKMINFKTCKTKEEEMVFAEERLFYVALTRTKNRVLL